MASAAPERELKNSRIAATASPFDATWRVQTSRELTMVTTTPTRMPTMPIHPSTAKGMGSILGETENRLNMQCAMQWSAKTVWVVSTAFCLAYGRLFAAEATTSDGDLADSKRVIEAVAA